MNPTNPDSSAPDIGLAIYAACVMEVLAPKPGNVHAGTSLSRSPMTAIDFLKSAAAIRPVFASDRPASIGELVLEAVRATRAAVRFNTNLGQVLLLAPAALALRRFGTIDPATIRSIVASATVDDSAQVYEAIRLANPGGMGRKPSQDIADEPTLPLGELMAMARTYDDVAAQYADSFPAVFTIRDEIRQFIRVCGGWKEAIVAAHVRRLRHGDTLVRRKCGPQTEDELKRRAKAVFTSEADLLPEPARLEDLDAWLWGDGNRRNPGTTADLVTAALFVGLIERRFEIPPEITAPDISDLVHRTIVLTSDHTPGERTP